MFLGVCNKVLPLIFMLLLGLSNMTYAADIQVKIDRNPVNLQESFQLVFTANETPDDDPDFSPLEKDFEILSQAQQQSMTFINLKYTKVMEWAVTVRAKRAGSLIIPAIHFGKDNSLVTAVVVNKESVQAAGNTNQDLFLQVSVDKQAPYIQEQVIYTLKLFRKVDISQASLTEPALNDAVIVRLGEDKSYSANYNGEKYVVVEREYAIFPQRSGSMTIAPLTLTAGVVSANQQRYNSFFSQQRTRNQRVVSDSVNLEVQAKPANANSPIWLPAEQVYIEEKWSIDPNEVVLGEPVTRTVSLFVKGVTVSALPELQKQKLPKQIKAYPDQPLLKETPQGKTLVAFREEKMALIASEVGTYTLPAIEIPWWNTQTQRLEKAVIPEKVLVVIAGEQSPVPVVPPVANTQIPVASAPVIVENSQLDVNKLWIGLALFFAIAWLLTLGYFLSNKKPKVAAGVSPKRITKKLSAVKSLRQACRENDSDKAKQALLEWGKESFEKNNLEAIAQQCDAELSIEIQSLNTTLYSQNAVQWQGELLWSAFQQRESLVDETKPVDSLPPLFKI